MDWEDMTRKNTLLKLLRACGKDNDYEQAHINADEFLLAYINDKEITKLWNKINKNFKYA